MADPADGPYGEWQVEEGIAEHRALLIRHGEAIAAKLDWPGPLGAGHIEDARLIARATGSTRGTARFASGEEALVDGLPRDAAEGAPIRLIVTRAAITEGGNLSGPARRKLAHCRPTTKPPQHAPSLARRLRETGLPVRVVRCFEHRLWDDVFADAWDGTLRFSGGGLIISPTPGMVVIDIDGTLPPRALALASVPSLVAAIGRMDLTGPIAIDFPTLADKADRRALDDALGDALARNLPFFSHERTAMNGFGLVQIIARQTGPSLPARMAADRAGAGARALLRRAEGPMGPGVLLLTAHPAVRAAIHPDWTADLARRSGRVLRWQDDPTLALDGGFAQAIAS